MPESMENSQENQPDEIQHCKDDVCQIRRTVRMLDLAAARVSYALQDGNDSVETLINSFTHMTEHVMAIQKGIEELPNTPEKDQLLTNCQQAMNTVQETTMAFQFYDRLNQRMQHISISLDELSSLIDEPERMSKPESWKELEVKIRSHYTLDNDLEMFDAVLAGGNIEDILSKATEAKEEVAVELF